MLYILMLFNYLSNFPVIYSFFFEEVLRRLYIPNTQINTNTALVYCCDHTTTITINTHTTNAHCVRMQV